MDHLLRSLTSILAFGIATLGAADASLGQTSCREIRLSASDRGVYQSLGFAVVVSGDTALVSAQWDDDLGSESGSVYVFRSNVDEYGTWIQTQKLLASDGDRGEHFGRAVAIDGDTALVAATSHLHNENAGNGSAYVFRYTGTTWIEQQELVASDGEIVDVFGQSVSLFFAGSSPFTSSLAWRCTPLRPVARVSEPQRVALIDVRPSVFTLGALNCAGMHCFALLLVPV